MSQQESPHLGDTERIEHQAPGYEVVQDWDPASGVLQTCYNGHVPEFYPTQEGYGSRFVRKKDQDCVRYYNPAFPFWRKRGPSYLVPARSASYLARTPRRGYGAQTWED